MSQRPKMPSVPFITAANAQELAALAHAKRKQNKEHTLQVLAELQQAPADKLLARAHELNDLLSGLKRDLREAKDSQDKLRLAQAIDRLEQSWARYAGIPTPPKARPMSRRTPPAAGPLD